MSKEEEGSNAHWCAGIRPGRSETDKTLPLKHDMNLTRNRFRMMAKRTRQQVMRSLASVRSELQKHRIRDACDYAEVLVAEAVGGIRKVSGVNKGFDVQSPLLGRIEVKCRQLPSDGRIEERVTLGNAKEGGFDHLAIVVFKPDFEVKGAVLVPYWRVWDFVQANRYGRISYGQACQLADAIDITAAVVAAANR